MVAVSITAKRLAALKAIVETPGKSGKFWRDLGHVPTTLTWLENEGFAEGKARDVFQDIGLRQSWFATRKGQKLVETRKL